VTLKIDDHRNKLHFTIYSHRKQLIYYFYCILDQIDAALVSRKVFFNSELIAPKVLNSSAFNKTEIGVENYIANICTKHIIKYKYLNTGN